MGASDNESIQYIIKDVKKFKMKTKENVNDKSHSQITGQYANRS